MGFEPANPALRKCTGSRSPLLAAAIIRAAMLS